jgi:hypothetical protein
MKMIYFASVLALNSWRAQVQQQWGVTPCKEEGRRAYTEFSL